MKILGITIEKPDYFHRDLECDLIGLNDELISIITHYSLSLISLYKPASFPLSVGMSSLRTLGYVFRLKWTTAEQKPEVIFHTAFSAAALAGIVFSHRIGMLISTTHGLANDIIKGLKYLKGTEKKPTGIKVCRTIINNGLYLALFFSRRTELKIASLGIQAIAHLYDIHSLYRFLESNDNSTTDKKSSSDDDSKANDVATLVGACALSLLIARVSQMREPLKVLAHSWSTR